MQETPILTPNMPELTVSEVSLKLKSLVERTFDVVQVRGELTGVKAATSGHVYMAIKDDNAVMDVICWKGTASKLPFRLEDGLDVVIIGKITTYPARSKYQLIVQSISLAGEGALLKQLEMLKEKLRAEGLFDPQYKKAIPSFPKTIAVVTSTTGAVIRDILHRLEDRFPCHVIVYPVTVQGDKAAEEIAQAIRHLTFLQNNPDKSPIPPIDTMIVARGGGSIEDLWCFNSEIIARAVFECPIPTISAIGHETDTTLIDYVADLRAPTPTAAAELSVPVRSELLAHITDLKKRILTSQQRAHTQKIKRLDLIKAAIRHPDILLIHKTQKLDYTYQALLQIQHNKTQHIKHKLAQLIQSLGHLSINLKHPTQELRSKSDQLSHTLHRIMRYKIQTWTKQALKDRIHKRMLQTVDQKQKRLEQLQIRLNNMSYQQTLKRGFALVYQDEKLITSTQEWQDHKNITIKLHDGEKELTPSP